MKDKSLKRVEIIWRDSMADRQAPWQPIEDYIKEFEEETFLSIGYLVHKDKHNVHICQNLHGFDGKYDRGGNYFTIPLGCIIKIKYLKKNEK